MAPLGPHSRDCRVAVAVSGGADSMALALLARQWGQPQAFIVDHGLRPGSDAEAALTAARLGQLGVPARVLTLTGLPHGPALAARARTARYRALTEACRGAGLVDLLLGHHARDQAETVLMRSEAGSGPAGLAGMAAVAHASDVRLLRPLASVTPARLRATLRAAGVAWVEDPSNRDPATLRARLRQRPGLDEAGAGDAYASERADSERTAAEALAVTAAIRPEGFALVASGPMSPAWVSALIWAVSGRDYPPPRRPVAAWAARPGPATLHGVQLGWRDRDSAWLLCREPAACAAAVPAIAGARWDGRFILQCCAAPGSTMGALGANAAGLRGWSDLPAIVLRSLPAIRSGRGLTAVPHLGFPDAGTCARLPVLFRPARPVAGLPFVPVPFARVPFAPMPRIRGCIDGNDTLSWE